MTKWAGFEAEVARANASEMGRRNGGAMLAGAAGERALLLNLLARLRELDADVYCGHNLAAFDLDVLLHRLQHHKVPVVDSLNPCCAVRPGSAALTPGPARSDARRTCQPTLQLS